MIKNLEDVQKLSKDNMDATMKSFGALSKASQAIATEVADYSKKSFEDGTKVMEKLLGAKSLATVESLLQVATDLGPTDELRGEIATLRAGLDMFKGDVSHGIRLCEQALTLLPADNWLRGLAVRTLSVLYLLKGDVATADRLLEENIRASQQAGDVIGLSASLRRLSSLCMLRGQLHRAREFYQRSFDVCAETPGRPWSVAGRSLVHLGSWRMSGMI